VRDLESGTRSHTDSVAKPSAFASDGGSYVGRHRQNVKLGRSRR